MRVIAAVVAIVIALPRLAHAEDDLASFLIGPVLGLSFGQKGGLLLGVEGGAGYGPERINLGFEHRSEKMFYYAELDPWLYLGGTVGVGIDEDSVVHPVLGVWEGLPLNNGSCYDWHNQLTIAGGYRYTGVHELYITLKAGTMHGFPCFN